MSLDTQTKLAIYRHFTETGQRPSLEIIAERVGSDVSSVRKAYVRLRAQRVLVLEADGASIRMAPPFSGVELPRFRGRFDSFAQSSQLRRFRRRGAAWRSARARCHRFQFGASPGKG